MRKLLSWLCVGLLVLGSVGGVLGAEITANCYTKCDGEILPRNTTDASNYTYHNASNRKAPSIKNETNTVELDTDAIYRDFGVNASDKSFRIDCRLNNTTAEIDKSMNLSKYINGTNYDAWKAGELANPNVTANDTLFVSPRPDDNESGYWIEKSFYDIFPYVIKRQADGIHVDCIKVLVVFYEFVFNPEPTPEPQPEPVNNSTNGTDPVVNNTTDVDVNNTTDINGTVITESVANVTNPVTEAGMVNKNIPTSATEVANDDCDPRSINLGDFKTGSEIDLLIIAILVVLVAGYYNYRRNH